MKRLNKLFSSYSITIVLILFCAFTFGANIRSWSNIAGRQSNEKTINIRNWPGQPFEILDLRVKGKEVKSLEKFEGDEHWVRGIQLKLRNKSEQPIVYIRIAFSFPETEVNKPKNVFDVEFGKHPADQWRKRQVEPVFLIKNDIVTLFLKDQEHNRIQNSLQRVGFLITNLTKLEIYIPEVLFADGMRWNAGEMYEPDINTPSGWRRVITQK